MNEYSPFVREIVEWAGTIPVVEIQRTIFPGGHFVLRILSEKGSALEVHLQALNGDEKTPAGLENLNPLAARRVKVWEDLWHTKQAIVKSRIAALLGISERIPARLTQVRRLDRPTTLRFLQENHLQDAVLPKFKYGLFLPKKHYRVLQNPPEADELLVAVATFARPRHFARAEGVPYHSYELVRFANLLNTTVVGGLDKLLSHFIKEHQPDDLMTYADLDWSDGQSYRKLGFEAISDTLPQLFWVELITMKRYLPHRLPDGLTGENAAERGFLTVYNAGSRKFVKVFTPTT